MFKTFIPTPKNVQDLYSNSNRKFKTFIHTRTKRSRHLFQLQQKIQYLYSNSNRISKTFIPISTKQFHSNSNKILKAFIPTPTKKVLTLIPSPTKSSRLLFQLPNITTTKSNKTKEDKYLSLKSFIIVTFIINNYHLFNTMTFKK